MKNILVTGATGLLGSNLISYLLNQPFNKRIIAVSRGQTSKKLFPFRDDIIMLSGDINDYNFIDGVINHYNIDEIYHLAAEAIVSSSNKSPLRALQTNIIGTANILESARHNKVKGIICMASDKFYGQNPKIPYKEEYQPYPQGVYEVSKTCSDMICNMYIMNYDLPIISVRGANLFGPGDFNFTRLVPNSIIRLINNQKPFLWSDAGDYIREFIYVKDAVEILIKLMEKAILRQHNTSINLGVGQVFQVKDFVKEIINSVKEFIPEIPNEIEFKVKDNYFSEIPKQSLDLTLLKKTVGELPKRTELELTKCLHETFNFYLEYYLFSSNQLKNLNKW